MVLFGVAVVGNLEWLGWCFMICCVLLWQLR